MRWRVVKLIPLNEVQRRVEDMEERYGAIEELHSEFISGNMDRRRLEDYIRWTEMKHAIRAYSEGEEFDYYAEMEFDLDREMYEKLTTRRLELLDHLSSVQVTSINQLSREIGRDVKNVYNDLQELESLGFIRLVSEGRSLRPELLVQELTLLLA
ncbi:MAG: hypothetical protein ACLFVP_01650 [Candidatus Bathyarchaeia archaeon]